MACKTLYDFPSPSIMEPHLGMLCLVCSPPTNMGQSCCSTTHDIPGASILAFPSTWSTPPVMHSYLF